MSEPLDRATLIAFVKAQAEEWRTETSNVNASDYVDYFDAIAALLEAEAWQPIETAPKDPQPTHWRPLPAPPVTEETDEVRCENCDQPIPDEGDRRVTDDDVTLCVDCWENIDWTAPPVTGAR